MINQNSKEDDLDFYSDKCRIIAIQILQIALKMQNIFVKDFLVFPLFFISFLENWKF